tara:strand:+ start:685 stop:1137 length:453 start_codon:yes stop_codon:yes gene_type:complete
MEDERDDFMEVVNLDRLVEFSRQLIFYNFAIEDDDDETDDEFIAKVKNIKKEDKEELDRLLPFQESKLIFKSLIKKQVNRKTKKVRYVIKESDYDEVLVELNARMVSNIIRSLVKKGLVEAAFDDDKNDFVFWVSKLGEDYHGNFETDEF